VVNKGLQGYRRVCRGNQRFKGAYRFTGVYKGFEGYTRVKKRFTGVYKGLRGYTGVYRGMLELLVLHCLFCDWFREHNYATFVVFEIHKLKPHIKKYKKA